MQEPNPVAVLLTEHQPQVRSLECISGTHQTEEGPAQNSTAGGLWKLAQVSAFEIRFNRSLNDSLCSKQGQFWQLRDLLNPRGLPQGCTVPGMFKPVTCNGYECSLRQHCKLNLKH